MRRPPGLEEHQGLLEVGDRAALSARGQGKGEEEAMGERAAMGSVGVERGTGRERGGRVASRKEKSRGYFCKEGVAGGGGGWSGKLPKLTGWEP
jgi:hypothetical protein